MDKTPRTKPLAAARAVLAERRAEFDAASGDSVTPRALVEQNSLDDVAQVERPPSPLLKADALTLAISAEKDGKLRVRSTSWDDARIVEPGRQLVIRNIERQAHVYNVPAN